MKNVAIISTKQNDLVLNILGIQNFFIVNTKEEAKKQLEQLIKLNFILIFIEKNLFKQIEKTIEKYKFKKKPIISSLPSLTEYEKFEIKEDFTYKIIKKIVGNDITI